MTPKESRHNRDVDEFGVADLQGPGAVDWIANQRNRGQDPRDAEKNQMRREGSCTFAVGAVVETDAGIGVVTDRFVFDATFAGQTVTASGDDPAYAVAVEDPDTGFVIAHEADIDPGEITVEDASPDDITEIELVIDRSETPDAEITVETATLSVTEFEYPEAWDDSPTANRIILLKLYASLGGTLPRVRDAVVDEVRHPDVFATAVKDHAMMTTDWRAGE